MSILNCEADATIGPGWIGKEAVAAQNEKSKSNQMHTSGRQAARRLAPGDFGLLLSPANSVVIVVDPLKDLVSDLDALFTKDLEAKTTAFVEIATSFNIPIIVSALGADGDADGLIAGQSLESDGHQIIWRKTINPWDEGKLLSQLECYGHPALVIAGAAEIPSVTLTVLGALEEGYDVHFLADFGASWSSSIEAEISLLRLVQAGAVPTTLNQVLAEWACGDPRSICRVALDDWDQRPNLQKEFWRRLDGLNK